MEYPKLINFLDTTTDNVSRFIIKKWVEVYDQSGSAEDRCKPSKHIRIKTSSQGLIYVILVMYRLL